MDEVAATPTEPAAPAANVTVTDTTISGNTANQEGGGLALDFIGTYSTGTFDESSALITGAGPGGGPHVRVFGTYGGHDFTPDGRQLVVSIKDGGIDATDAFFSELGSDDTGKITGPGQGGGPHVKVFDGRAGIFPSENHDGVFGGEHSNNFEEIK